MSLTRRRLISSLWPLSLGSIAAGCVWARHRPSHGATTRLPPEPPEQVAALLRAVRQGDAGEVRRLLLQEPTLAGARDGEARSAFALAHWGGHDEVAALLQAAGIELDLVESALAGTWDRFDELAAADPALARTPHALGGPPLWVVATAGRGELYRLRSIGADAEQRGIDGTTAARAAMTCRTITGARIAATDLLSNGARVDTQQPRGDSVLHGAVRRRSASLVRLAVRKGADVDACDDEGRTPQDLAAELGWSHGVTLLAAHGDLPRDHRASRFWFDAERRPVRRPDLADVPQPQQSAITGNSHARLARVRELVGCDARLVFSVSTDDELAIEACAHTGNADIMRFHLDRGAPLSLPTAVSLGDRDTIRFLLERDPQLVHERGAHDFPVLFYVAFGTGSVELAELLRGYGVEVDQQTAGTTTLHWCVKRDRVDLARWLLDQGAGRRALSFAWDRRGQTPAELAITEGSRAMRALLS